MDLDFARRTAAFWQWFAQNEALLADLAQNTENRTPADAAFIARGTDLISKDFSFRVSGDFTITFAASEDEFLFFLLRYITAGQPAELTNKWKISPGERESADRIFHYSRTPEDVEPRRDIYRGSSKCGGLITDYSAGAYFAAISRFGARPLFIFYFHDPDAAEEAVEAEREAVAAALAEEALGEENGSETGVLLGGASGGKCAYIDLLLYDAETFWPRAAVVLTQWPHLFFCADFKEGSPILPLAGPDTPDLLGRLHLLHLYNAHERITQTIEQIPPARRGYALTSLYGRALNNLDRYGDALAALLPLKAAGENDALWHFRVGYAYYYLDREEEAAGYLERAYALGDHDEATCYLLKTCQKILVTRKWLSAPIAANRLWPM
ncbi:MAG: hypothetical protein LBK56_03440 [Gracilibacteraceae bacterium]|nr:hypothetical protein [Gracilibacteraceae bacterium]